MSTNGILGTGCPSIYEPFNLSDISCSSVIVPALYKLEYKIGAACPFESTSLSFKKWAGFLGWNLSPASWKKRTEKISAIDEHEVGCPLFVTLTDLIESILNQWPISWFPE